MSKRIWAQPWNYSEGFAIGFGLLFIGFLLEYFTPGFVIKFPSWPLNIISGIIFLLFLLFLYFTQNQHPVIVWFSSIPAAVCSVGFLVFQVFIMALVPQNTEGTHPIGLDHVLQSWNFLLASIFVLTSLGFVVLRRSWPLNKSNIAFLINHLGLWMLVMTATLGSGDLIRLQMFLYEGETVSHAFDNDRNPRELPLALKLIDFNISEYSPKIVLANYKKNEIPPSIKNNLQMAEKGLKLTIKDWKIEVLDVLPTARDSNNIYYASTDTGAAPAVYLSVESANAIFKTKAWISCGSPNTNMKFLKLNDSMCFALTQPQPKKFSSLVTVYSPDGVKDSVMLEVNKPIKVNGWKLYQVSYNEDKGKYSEYSVIEAVKDPWLPIVYSGFFMLIAGSAYMFWVGRK